MRNDEPAATSHEETREIIQRLVFAAECKNPDGNAHLQRVSYYTDLLARAHALPTRVCHLICIASPMHDIGKVGIPDSILLKPGKLTPEEWEVMQTHTIIGAKLLSDGISPILQLGEVIARSHHERWDGSGYPQGLKGEAIPIAGRIMAIADVFDAMTTDRPYEKAWPIAEAVDVIKLGSDTQFDPQIVAHFLKLLPKFLHVRKYFSEKNFSTDTETFSSEDAHEA